MNPTGSSRRADCTYGCALRKWASSELSFRKSLSFASEGFSFSFLAIQGWLLRNWSNSATLASRASPLVDTRSRSHRSNSCSRCIKARGSCLRSACTKGWAFRKLRSSLLSFRKSLLLARVGSLRSFSAIQGWLERNCSKERNSSRVFSFSYCHCHGPWATPFAPSPRVARNINNADRAKCGVRLTVFHLFLSCAPFRPDHGRFAATYATCAAPQDKHRKSPVANNHGEITPSRD